MNVRAAERKSFAAPASILSSTRCVLAVLVFVAACAAPTESPAPITVLDGAYEAVSINGQSLPVQTVPTADSAQHEIIAERLWLGGSAGLNGAMHLRAHRVIAAIRALFPGTIDM